MEPSGLLENTSSFDDLQVNLSNILDVSPPLNVLKPVGALKLLESPE